MAITRPTRPRLYIIAGPNGAGKTTFALRFLPEIAGCRNFVNADMIARGISPLNVETAAIQAGRYFLAQIESRMRKRETFAFESTLSGRAYARWITAARKRGYKVSLYYLWIPSVRLALKRIEERVRRGGHNIPADVVRRRYGRGVANLFRYYMPLADYVAIFDNSSAWPELVFEKHGADQDIVRPGIFDVIQQQAGDQT